MQSYNQKCYDDIKKNLKPLTPPTKKMIYLIPKSKKIIIFGTDTLSGFETTLLLFVTLGWCLALGLLYRCLVVVSLLGCCVAVRLLCRSWVVVSLLGCCVAVGLLCRCCRVVVSTPDSWWIHRFLLCISLLSIYPFGQLSVYRYICTTEEINKEVSKCASNSILFYLNF